jgi:hypothetical protein
MFSKDAILALKMVNLALDEVQSCGGNLPDYGEESCETFLALVKGYAEGKVSEAQLIEVIDAAAPLFDDVPFAWK